MISASVKPEASISSTSQTVTRSPLMHGCPERCPGTSVIPGEIGLVNGSHSPIVRHLLNMGSDCRCYSDDLGF